jgi:hypothetical protein
MSQNLRRSDEHGLTLEEYRSRGVVLCPVQPHIETGDVEIV